MPIIGTAGHVDHGKSTLVLSLTGRDPDRWVEEKERGLTIDLGFAWTELDESLTVGFVDVPGHERFIKNMLAGIGAIDVALLVVAADEGWMPQTEEHVSVLDLLGIECGVVAVTRSDLVDTDMIELAQLEVADRVAGTTLEGWPVVAVSAPTGRGIDELKRALIHQLGLAGEPSDLRRPRLWIDRAFTITGAGTVVTGTLTGGAIRRGDELSLWPGGHAVRVRTIQSHEQEVGEIGPGNRTALNLAGLDHADVARGAQLTGIEALRESRQLFVSLLPVRTLGETVSEKGAYHAHVGSGTWPVTLRLVSQDADGSATALLTFDRDIAVEVGDRFILREVGRRAVIGGGRVLDPHPSAKLRVLRESASRLIDAVGSSPDQRAQTLLDVRGQSSLAGLLRDSGGGRPSAGFMTETAALSSRRGGELTDEIEKAVLRYQADNPLRDGIPKGEILSSHHIENDVLTTLVDRQATLVDDGTTLRTAEFRGGWGTNEQRAFEAAERLLLADGLSVPRASQLGLDPEVMHACVRSRRLVRVGEDLLYLPSQILDITTRLETLPAEFTIAELRDAYGLTRRQAVPLAEWLDGEGWTSRTGDVRAVRRRPPER